ncbi:hypothetical protein [Streptomyces canus]
MRESGKRVVPVCPYVAKFLNVNGGRCAFVVIVPEPRGARPGGPDGAE